MGAATPVIITIGGMDIDAQEGTGGDILGFTVERDIGQPDMASIVLSNQEASWSGKIKNTDAVEIKVGDDKVSIFKGEVAGLEASYRGGEKARLTVRALNKLHRLLRKRKSMTYTDKTDQQILSQVASDHGLSLKWKHEKTITYKHVYQHNQSDMEFLRMRAARMGCHIWCVGTDLYVQEPDLNGSAEKLSIGDTKDSPIRSFSPRMSSAPVQKKVTVKGWNPETKELIQGDYTAKPSKLGKENAVQGSADHGSNETFTVDHPIWSVDEAKAIAKARHTDLAMQYMTGECEVTGNPKYELGKVVEISASSEATSANDPFNGKYYVMGLTHRFSLSKQKEGGYITILRLARDAQKG